MAKLNWFFPIAAGTEYSGGSWMPDSLTHRGRLHAAIDIYAEAGAPIIAPVSGVVTKAGTGETAGNFLKLKGDDGIDYYFAHMGQPALFSSGQRIGIGAMFGVVGNTGSAKRTKNHLHFAMTKNGDPINPINYLRTGYKIPEFAAIANQDIPDNYEQTQEQPQPGQVGYVSPFEVAENAIADSDELLPQSDFSPEAFLSNAMEMMSGMAAGGERTDYRTTGVTNVARSLIPTSVAVDEGGDTDGDTTR